MELLENINGLEKNINNNLIDLQDKFLNSTLGQVTNLAIDVGLKTILPDNIEDEVIEVKDALITGGLEEGIDVAVKNAVDIGKKIIGLEKTEFNSIEQALQAVNEGNYIEGLSNGLDFVLDNASDLNIIPDNIASLIKEGKNIILNDVDTGVKNEFENEIKALNKLEKYISNWEKCYLKKDMPGLIKEYNKIEKQMVKILPIEKLMKEVNKIRNINDLINNSDNFDFDKIYLDLANNISKIA